MPKYKAEINRVSSTRAFVEINAESIDEAYVKILESAHKQKFSRVENVFYEIKNLRSEFDVTTKSSAPVTDSKPLDYDRKHEHDCIKLGCKKCDKKNEPELGFA